MEADSGEDEHMPVRGSIVKLERLPLSHPLYGSIFHVPRGYKDGIYPTGQGLLQLHAKIWVVDKSSEKNSGRPVLEDVYLSEAS